MQYNSPYFDDFFRKRRQKGMLQVKLIFVIYNYNHFNIYKRRKVWYTNFVYQKIKGGQD